MEPIRGTAMSPSGRAQAGLPERVKLSVSRSSGERITRYWPSPERKKVLGKPAASQRAQCCASDWSVSARSTPVMVGASEKVRSEEHTSELQSLMRISYAVFCLKKKRNKQMKAKYKERA